MVPVVTALLADDAPPKRGTIVAIDAAGGVDVEVADVQPTTNSKIPVRQKANKKFFTLSSIPAILVTGRFGVSCVLSDGRPAIVEMTGRQREKQLLHFYGIRSLAWSISSAAWFAPTALRFSSIRDTPFLSTPFCRKPNTKF